MLASARRCPSAQTPSCGLGSRAAPTPPRIITPFSVLAESHAGGGSWAEKQRVLGSSPGGDSSRTNRPAVHAGRAAPGFALFCMALIKPSGQQANGATVEMKTTDVPHLNPFHLKRPWRTGCYGDIGGTMRPVRAPRAARFQREARREADLPRHRFRFRFLFSGK